MSQEYISKLMKLFGVDGSQIYDNKENLKQAYKLIIYQNIEKLDQIENKMKDKLF